jgi:HSP20 family protein
LWGSACIGSLSVLIRIKALAAALRWDGMGSRRRRAAVGQASHGSEVMKSLLPFGRREVAAEGDPFTTMRREMDRWFDEMTRSVSLARPALGMGVMAPRVDVKETERGLEVHAELPGVTEKDVEVQLADGVLTIRGEKKQDREEKEKGWYLMERSYGSFLRQIPLPVEVEEDKVEARFDKGVLTVTLPRSPKSETRTKTIEIKPAA